MVLGKQTERGPSGRSARSNRRFSRSCRITSLIWMLRNGKERFLYQNQASSARKTTSRYRNRQGSSVRAGPFSVLKGPFSAKSGQKAVLPGPENPLGDCNSWRILGNFKVVVQPLLPMVAIRPDMTGEGRNLVGVMAAPAIHKVAFSTQWYASSHSLGRR